VDIGIIRFLTGFPYPPELLLVHSHHVYYSEVYGAIECHYCHHWQGGAKGQSIRGSQAQVIMREMVVMVTGGRSGDGSSGGKV